MINSTKFLYLGENMTQDNKDSQEIIDTLGKSGEGISKFKIFSVKHIFFPILNRFISWDKAWDIFDTEGQKIIELSKQIEKDDLFKRVLVPKLFGLEDNSRYYSVGMTIEHLLIVASALQVRVPLLSRGKKLKNDVTIKSVKPYKEIDEDIVEQFEDFLNTYREKLERNVDDINIDNTSSHPWFGEFNPKQWSILAMIHQIIHKRQIKAIIKGLNS
jgi:hypothetical protein